MNEWIENPARELIKRLVDADTRLRKLARAQRDARRYEAFLAVES